MVIHRWPVDGTSLDSIPEWHCSISITPVVAVVIVRYFHVRTCPVVDCCVHLLKFDLPVNGCHAWSFLSAPHNTASYKILPLAVMGVFVSLRVP